MEADIKNGNNYVLETEGNTIGTFSVIPGGTPLFNTIFDGKWIYRGTNYASTGRLAIDISQKGKGYGQLMLS